MYREWRETSSPTRIVTHDGKTVDFMCLDSATAPPLHLRQEPRRQREKEEPVSSPLLASVEEHGNLFKEEVFDKTSTCALTVEPCSRARGGCAWRMCRRPAFHALGTVITVERD